MKEVQVRIFGALRSYLPHTDTIHLQVAFPLSVRDFKQALLLAIQKQAQNFNDFQLLQDSAIACDTSVLSEETILEKGESFAVLPPVCGG